VGDRSLTPATWLAGVSPLSAPAYAAASLVSTDYVLPKEVARAIPRAFWFWQGVTGLTTVWLLWRLRQIRQARHALVYGEGPEAVESRRAPAV
jgi:hypothetical protein